MNELERTMCYQCGSPLVPGMNFCQTCGANQQANPAAGQYNAPQANSAPMQYTPPQANPAPMQYTTSQANPAPMQYTLPQANPAPMQYTPPQANPTAGQYVAPPANPAIAEFNAQVEKDSHKLQLNPRMLIGGAVALVAIIVIIVIIVKSQGPNFKKIYNTYCSYTWADVADDGSWLSIDTNPYDYDDDGVAYPEAYEAVEKVNRELGLPSSLYDEIGKTRAIDGTQYRDYDKVSVSWHYHPDTGLEITYRKN